MTQDVSKVTTTSTEEKGKTPVKEFWIIEIFKKLLEFNYMKSGIKKKF